MMNQDEYRAQYHFRPVRVIASGEQVFADDLTFDPAVHEELDAPKKKVASVIKDARA